MAIDLSLIASALLVFSILGLILMSKAYGELKSSYNRLQLKPVAPLPEWSRAGDSGAVSLSGGNGINQYWVQTNGGSTQTLTFSPAADVVAAAPNKSAGSKYTMIINNNSGHTMTFHAGSGNTLSSFPANLATNHYLIVNLVLTNVNASSEAVTYEYVSDGSN